MGILIGYLHLLTDISSLLDASGEFFGGILNHRVVLPDVTLEPHRGVMNAGALENHWLAIWELSIMALRIKL